MNEEPQVPRKVANHRQPPYPRNPIPHARDTRYRAELSFYTFAHFPPTRGRPLHARGEGGAHALTRGCTHRAPIDAQSATVDRATTPSHYEEIVSRISSRVREPLATGQRPDVRPSAPGDSQLGIIGGNNCRAERIVSNREPSIGNRAPGSSMGFRVL